MIKLEGKIFISEHGSETMVFSCIITTEKEMLVC